MSLQDLIIALFILYAGVKLIKLFNYIKIIIIKIMIIIVSLVINFIIYFTNSIYMLYNNETISDIILNNRN